MEAFMSAAATGMEKALWSWCLVLWLSVLLTDGVVRSELVNESCTSRCGIITNISSPFRLRDDPPHCGDRSYELACENNVTLLYLQVYIYNSYPDNGSYRSVGKYRVMGINYNNFTIRLVDPVIQDGNCSRPLYSLSLFDFDTFGNPYPSYSSYSDDDPILYRTRIPNSNRTGFIPLNKQVGYLECSDAVEDAAYVDTAPCVNWEGGGHLYAVAGDLLGGSLNPQCRLKSVALIASDWESLVPGGTKTYADIHTLLSSGFELSWWARACADRNCPRETICYFIPEAQDLQCLQLPDDSECIFLLGIIHICNAGRPPKLRIVVEDYVRGITEGLISIAGQMDREDYRAAIHFTNQILQSH